MDPSPGLTPENNLDLLTSLFLPRRNGLLSCEGRDEKGWKLAGEFQLQEAGKPPGRAARGWAQPLWDCSSQTSDWEVMKELIGLVSITGLLL